MAINWFTVIAQIFNFLILVWLLKRFLYNPILNAIDKREKQIAEKIKAAEEIKSEAINERNEFQKKNSDFDQLRNQQWNEAIDEIKIKKQLLSDEAYQESEAFREKLKKTFQDEQKNLRHAIIRKTQDEVFLIARKILRDLADENLEQQIVIVFINRLKNLNEEERNQLLAAFSTSKNPVNVRSTFDLIQSQHEEIEKSIKILLGSSVLLIFKTNPEMISGIELQASGYKLSWSISEYLSSVEKNISETINTKLKINQQEE